VDFEKIIEKNDSNFFLFLSIIGQVHKEDEIQHTNQQKELL